MSTVATTTISVRIPDVLLKRMRTLRSYVAHAADVPMSPTDVTNSDVAKRALVLGLEAMERHRQVEIAEGTFLERVPSVP